MGNIYLDLSIKRQMVPRLFSNSSDVGQYLVLYQIGFTSVSTLGSLLTAFILPIIYQRTGDSSDNTRNKSVSRMLWLVTFICLIITSLICIIALFFHSQILGIFVPDNFKTFSFMLPWVICAGGIFAASQILNIRYMSELKTKDLLILKIQTSLIGILFNLVGAWSNGVKGVVYSLLVFSIFYFLTSVFGFIRLNNKFVSS